MAALPFPELWLHRRGRSKEKGQDKRGAGKGGREKGVGGGGVGGGGAEGLAKKRVKGSGEEKKCCVRQFFKACNDRSAKMF